MIKRSEWLALSKDRLAMLLLFVMVMLVVVLILTTVFRLSPSDIQIPFRFTGYGLSNIDRAQWFILISYPIFGMIILAINGYLAVRIYTISRMLSVGVMAMSIFILLFALAIANAVFNLAPSV